MIYPEREGETVSDQPKLWACRCDVCNQKFQEKHGKPLPDRLTPEVRVFKEDSLVELTRILCDATKAQGMRASVCVLPFENSSTVNDWAKVAAIPSLDIIGTDQYWRPHQNDVGSYVGRFARRIQELSAQFQKESMLWILNFNIPKGEEPTIREALDAGYKEGIRNFAAWSYYGAAPMNLRAEDPETVWKTLNAGYQDLLKR